jgi:alpha-glucosidase
MMTYYYIQVSDVQIPPESVRDPWEKNVPGLGLGRDPCRTPMRWTSQPGAGFTSGVPWLPVGGPFNRITVADERDDPGSFLSLYRALLALRRAEPALSLGSYRERWADSQLLMYERAAGPRRFLIALNFSDQPCTLPQLHGAIRIRLSTHEGTRAEELATVTLEAHEGIVAEL